MPLSYPDAPGVVVASVPNRARALGAVVRYNRVVTNLETNATVCS